MKGQAKRQRAVRGRPAFLILLVALLVILGLILWARSNGGASGNANGSTTTRPSDAMTRTNEGGQVTIIVTWQGRAAGPIFAVEMDTHAVDLDSYNLRQLAVLRNDKGQEVQPIAWNAPTGGHHRKGTLSFLTTFADGTPVVGATTKSFELTVRNISDVPTRSFRWTL